MNGRLGLALPEESKFERKGNKIKMWLKDKAKPLNKIVFDENDCWFKQRKSELDRYECIAMWRNGELKMMKAHKAVYEAFNGTVPKGFVVMHTCDVKQCINPAHLKLGTQKDNMKDRSIKGRCNSPKGQNAVNSKLKDEDVIFIKRNPQISDIELGKMFNVSYQSIYYIRIGKNYAHIDPDNYVPQEQKKILTFDDYLDIYQMKESPQIIAWDYGLSLNTVCRIRRKELPKWVLKKMAELEINIDDLERDLKKGLDPLPVSPRSKNPVIQGEEIRRIRQLVSDGYNARQISTHLSRPYTSVRGYVKGIEEGKKFKYETLTPMYQRYTATQITY